MCVAQQVQYPVKLWLRSTQLRLLILGSNLICRPEAISFVPLIQIVGIKPKPHCHDRDRVALIHNLFDALSENFYMYGTPLTNPLFSQIYWLGRV